MGKPPKGFKPSPAVGKFGNPHSLDDPGVRQRRRLLVGRGPDRGQLLADNVGPDGTRDSLTADPPIGPQAGQNAPGFLPEECDPSGADLPGRASADAPATRGKIGDADHLRRGRSPAASGSMPPGEPGTAGAKRAAARGRPRHRRTLPPRRRERRLPDQVAHDQHGLRPALSRWAGSPPGWSRSPPPAIVAAERLRRRRLGPRTTGRRRAGARGRRGARRLDFPARPVQRLARGDRGGEAGDGRRPLQPGQPGRRRRPDSRPERRGGLRAVREDLPAGLRGGPSASTSST